MVYTIRDLIGTEDCKSCPRERERWSRSIPLPYYGGYLSAAWEVLRGRAVAVRYPVAGELEQALSDTGGIHVSAALSKENRASRPSEGFSGKPIVIRVE